MRAACDTEIQVLVSAYADGQVTPEEADRARAHLAACEGCQARVQEWGRLREMFQWAYTLEPDERPIPIPEAAPTLPTVSSKPRFRPRWRWDWRFAGATAAVAAASLLAYSLVVRPPLVGIGDEVAAQSSPRSVRMEGGISLTLSPGTAVRRLDASSIRLLRGSVLASVRHGTDFRVRSPLLEVNDLGTRFRVATGAKNDVVLVEEGHVSVRSGGLQRTISANQLLIADRSGTPSVSWVQSRDTTPEDPGIPLPKDSPGMGDPKNFAPEDGHELNREEGLALLHDLFPNLRLAGSSAGVFLAENGTDYTCQITTLAGVRKNLRNAFPDLAQALAGGPHDPINIPIAIVQPSGAGASVAIAADPYVLSLATGRGGLVWRLSGPGGSVQEVPATMGPALRIGSGGSISGLYSYTDEIVPARGFYGGKLLRLRFRLDAWPGELAPSLTLDFMGTRDSTIQSDEAAMERALNASSGDDHRVDALLYLDPARQNKVAVAWDRNAGVLLDQAFKLARRGQPVSVRCGAFISTVPLRRPALPAGAYGLWWVLPAGSASPHWEIGSLDGSRRQILSVPADAPVKGLFMDRYLHPGGGVSWTVPAASQPVSLCFQSMGQARPDFPFRFRLVRGPTGSDEAPWGEGWIWAAKQ